MSICRWVPVTLQQQVDIVQLECSARGKMQGVRV